MLVTFHTKAYADITLFGEVAKNLLKMMGHSGTIPGALLAADIPAARAHLQAALEAHEAAEAAKRAAQETEGEDEPEERKEPRPSLSLRAVTLLELLDAAARANCDVMWD